MPPTILAFSVFLDFLQEGMNFIFTCLPTSHSSLYEWLDYLEQNGEVQHLTPKHRKGKTIETYSYRFVNQIPLRACLRSLAMVP